jgi:hypothetical protein
MKCSAVASFRLESARGPFAAALSVLGFAALASACSVGNGSGEVTGVVNSPSCDLKDEAYDMDPTFFAAETAGDQVILRVQRGGDFEDKSDGLIVLVRDAELVRKEMLGMPIAVERARLTDTEEPLVQMTFYLNETCAIERRKTPTVFEATASTITFEALYAPRVNDDPDVRFSFDNGTFVDPDSPEDRNAVLSGAAEFLFSRGRPAQRFP